MNKIEAALFPERSSNGYKFVTTVRKGVIEGAKSFVISQSVIIGVVKMFLKKDISIEEASLISVIIGGICGGVKAAMNWYKNHKKL